MFTYRESFQILATRVHIKLLEKKYFQNIKKKNILPFQLQYINNIVYFSAAEIAIKNNKEVTYCPT